MTDLIEMTRQEYVDWLAAPGRRIEDLQAAIPLLETERQAAKERNNRIAQLHMARGLMDSERQEQMQLSERAYEFKVRIILAREAWSSVTRRELQPQIDQQLNARVAAIEADIVDKLVKEKAKKTP